MFPKCPLVQQQPYHRRTLYMDPEGLPDGYRRALFRRGGGDIYRCRHLAWTNELIGCSRLSLEYALRRPRVRFCARCDNCRLVCEAHPDWPWERARACGCGAPGDSCPVCIPLLGDYLGEALAQLGHSAE